MTDTIQTLTITQPDDWHIHLRDNEALATTVPHACMSFNRVICMPNLIPPVKTTKQAMNYRERILTALDKSDIPSERKNKFDPRMVLYTTAHEIAHAKASGIVQAGKLYPAGATTNSADGVTDILGRAYVFESMQKHGIPLLVHGEVTHNDVDIFDREKRFLDEVLSVIIKNFPNLYIVMEHITTKDAADFCLAQASNVGATITPQHLLVNRNHMLVGGNPKFFLGTDSAPHATYNKENACGCAGCYYAPHALPLYATAFERMGALDKLENFASRFGAEFYGLPVNTSTITLVKSNMDVPKSYPYLDDKTLTPLLAGQSLAWSVKQ